ncbi:MAG TPA: response regulator transcription factor [Candidatus Binataceae bacterium]|nr:response regulator transcription factor [Candidatus Binataceae bacterium]
MPSLRILIVEDESRLAEAIKKGLGEEGFATEWVSTAEAAEPILSAGAADLLVLDLGLPGKGGLDLLRELRESGKKIPVLVLTARGAVEDRVAGLDAGADDYLAKPFAFTELLARIRALSRRRAAAPEPILKVGDLEFDTIRRRVKLGTQTVNFSPKEKQLLELLMRNAGRVVTRDMIAETVWDADYNALTNLIEVFVNRLRQKLDSGPAEPGGSRPRIITVRGAGYTMRAE